MDLPAELPDLTEHVFRSVRGWLHGLFPATSILLKGLEEPDPDQPSRPLFNLSASAGPDWGQDAPGSMKLELSLLIQYAADPTLAPWDAQRTAGKIIANAGPPVGRIPMRLYNLPWPNQPAISVATDTGGTLPAVLDIAVASQGSAPSKVVTIHPGTAVVNIEPRNWPVDRPLATSYRVYAAAHGDPLQLQATIDAGHIANLAGLADPAGAAPPTNQSMGFWGIRLERQSTQIMQDTDANDLFDAAVTLRLCVRVPITTPAHLDDQLV